MFEVKTPEFQNIKGWINSKPLTLKQLKGKVVLLDFWTYSCINCLRTLPHIKQIYEKYKKYKFILIGVHTPEFDFERISENVKKAVKDLEIKYPVALDSDNITWHIYGNRYWPKQTLIDARGRIKYGHVGEGGYKEIEENIVKLLKENGEEINFKISHDQEFIPGFNISPETYAGSLRNNGIGNGALCVPGSCNHYIDPSKYELNVIYLDGDWIQDKEYLKHAGKKGSLIFKYNAHSINAVLVPDKKPFEAIVYLDNKYLTKENSSKDVRFHGKISYVKVTKPNLYELTKIKNIEQHTLKLETISKDFKLYAFTFG
ncbi:MAG: redoxin domain-containing protein [Nanoarchaeota archaeon]